MIHLVGENLKGSEWHPARRTLKAAMDERGIRWESVRILNPWEHSQIKNPTVIVALGNKALKLFAGDWDVRSVRGYVFDNALGPVLATCDPEDVHKEWTPWRVLLSLDLQKAKNIHKHGFKRPIRDVEIVY